MKKILARLRAWWTGKSRVIDTTPLLVENKRIQPTLNQVILNKKNAVINHPEVRLTEYIQLTTKDEMIIFDTLIREFFANHYALSCESKIQE